MIEGFGLAQPKLISTIGKDYEVQTQKQFYSLMESIDYDFAVKPIEGSGGRGILLVEKRGGNLLCNDQHCDLADLWDYVANGEFLLEEKVSQVEQLSNIYPSSLNTFRIATIKTDVNIQHIVLRFLRVGTEGRRVDNAGLGGIIILIDKEGKTFYAYNYKQNKMGLTHHPDTGAPLLGIQIKGYKEVINIALKASKKFSFMGTIGWDIALSDRGPLIIEANVFYDSWFVQVGNCGSILSEQTAKGLKKRNMFSRWDRTKIHPRFRRNRIVA